MKPKLIIQNKPFVFNFLFLFIWISFFINRSIEHIELSFQRKGIKPRSDIGLDGSLNVEVFNLDDEFNNNENENEELTEFNLDSNLDNEKEEKTEVNSDNTSNDNSNDIEIDFNLNDSSSNTQDKMTEESQDKNPNNSSNTNYSNNEINKDVTVTRVDPSEVKNGKVKFELISSMTPIKYLPDEKKKELKKQKENIVSISALDDGQINDFTNFRAQLNTFEQKIFDLIVNSSKKSPPDLEIIVSLSQEEYNSNVSNVSTSFEKIMTAITSQYTEFWWLGSYRLSSGIKSGSYYLSIKLMVDTNDSLNQIVNINKKFEVMKEDIVAKITSLNLTTDYAKIKYIHDYLVAKIVYTYERNHIRTLYGALVENKCVCEGYAEAFQYLASHYRINCIIARSDGHEWNFVKLNGNWYALDVTWDDPQIGSSMEPSGSFTNIQTTYFLVGQDSQVDINTSYKDEVDHKLVYTAYNSQNIAVKYPVLSTSAYSPSAAETQEANKVSLNNFFTSLSIGK